MLKIFRKTGWFGFLSRVINFLLQFLISSYKTRYTTQWMAGQKWCILWTIWDHFCFSRGQCCTVILYVTAYLVCDDQSVRLFNFFCTYKYAKWTFYRPWLQANFFSISETASVNWCTLRAASQLTMQPSFCSVKVLCGWNFNQNIMIFWFVLPIC